MAAHRMETDRSEPPRRLFYCPRARELRSELAKEVSPKTVPLPPDEAHHAARVLRLKTDDAVRLFDGEGFFYEGRIARADKRGVEVEIRSAAESQAEARRRVALIVGVLKGRKIDFLVQKSVELGVAEILLFPAERSVAKRGAAIEGEATDERIDRIVVSACKQCGRATLMPVRFFARLEDALDAVPAGATRYVFWEATAHSRAEQKSGFAAPDDGACALIGPEGGFTPEEIEAVRAAGFETRSLGPRILRAETAALAAATILLYQAGELS
ncbi:16S rRNA (uracil(1498)-N(3))-methyltransferase [Candidatus Sumerlaeota bacterium]|nr:16S rRNA (uracil(1498)-N(3))-methyltransferase [Candidatus Sumerlaeota bacterium]